MHIKWGNVYVKNMAQRKHLINGSLYLCHDNDDDDDDDDDEEEEEEEVKPHLSRLVFWAEVSHKDTG